MGVTSFFDPAVGDDEFTSDAQAAAVAAAEAQAAAEAAQAAAEAALAATLAALAAQVLDDHADVTAPAPIAGDFLQFIGGMWINNASGLNDLADVTLAGLALDDVLQYNGAIFVNQPLSALGFLLLSGGTMTGVLTLAADPVNPLEAATKQYVDAALSFYDIGSFFDGIPLASSDLLRFVANRNFYIPGSFSDSRAESRIATTLLYNADVQRNGVSIGTISWAALASVATLTITSASNENFVPGDVLSVVGQVAPDVTLDDITITVATILGIG